MRTPHRRSRSWSRLISKAPRAIFSPATPNGWRARRSLIVELHDWLIPKGKTSQPFLQCIAKLDRDFIYRGEDIYSIANDFDALAAS